MRIFIVSKNDEINKVFKSENLALLYLDQLHWDMTHYSTGRKRSPSRYLDYTAELKSYEVTDKVS